MADHDDELVDAVRELTRTIDALRTELHGSRRRPLLRPPTPRELLRFTDEVALPAALAVLETSVRALEAFQRSLQVVRTERTARDRTSATADAASERANELRRTTLSQLDTVLTELQRAASEGGLPANEEARDLLTEARELRDDVDSRLRAATKRDSDAEPAGFDRTRADGAVTIDIEDGPLGDGDASASDDEPDTAVDVDAELETLRDQYGEDGDDSSENDDDGSDANGSGAGAGGTENGSDGSDEN